MNCVYAISSTIHSPAKREIAQVLIHDWTMASMGIARPVLGLKQRCVKAVLCMVEPRLSFCAVLMWLTGLHADAYIAKGSAKP